MSGRNEQIDKNEGRKKFETKLKELGIRDEKALKDLSEFYNLCWAKANRQEPVTANLLIKCNSKEIATDILKGMKKKNKNVNVAKSQQGIEREKVLAMGGV